MDPERKLTTDLSDWPQSDAGERADLPEGMIAEDLSFGHRLAPKYGPEANEALDAVRLRREGERFPRKLQAHVMLLDPDRAIRWGMLLLSHGTLGFDLRLGMALSDALKIAADVTYPFDALIARATIRIFDVIALQQQIKAGTLILTVRPGDNEDQVNETIARAESHGIFSRTLKLPARIENIARILEEAAQKNARHKPHLISPNAGSSLVASPPSDVHKSSTRKVKREERLNRAAQAIDVLTEEFIAHPSTFDWLVEKMGTKCRAIAEELARRAPSDVEEVTKRLTEQARLRRAHGVPTDSPNTVEESDNASFTAISLHEADRKHHAVKYAAMKARVFGTAEPSAEGLQSYLDSVHLAAESGNAEEKSLICKTVNFWKDELGVEFGYLPESQMKKAKAVVCTITFKSDAGNGAYRLRSADKNQTDLYSRVKFPRLLVSSPSE